MLYEHVTSLAGKYIRIPIEQCLQPVVLCFETRRRFCCLHSVNRTRFQLPQLVKVLRVNRTDGSSLAAAHEVSDLLWHRITASSPKFILGCRNRLLQGNNS